MSNEVLDGIIAMLREGELSMSDPPAEARPVFEAMFAEVPMPEGVNIEPGEVGGIPGLWLKPAEAPEDKVILYLHGGAYVIGSANVYKTIAGGLAQASGLNLFIPDYRLAPEHPYPAAPDDVLSCYRALLADDNYRYIAVAGDSAGGGLVMGLLLNARAHNLAQPACAVLWSPWLDLQCALPSIRSNAAADPTLEEEGLKISVRHYLGNTIPDDEILHPLRADLSGLAPLLIQVGSIEILLDDALALATQAARHETHCQLEVWPGMPHVFQGFAPALAEGSRALKNTHHFIAQFYGEN